MNDENGNQKKEEVEFPGIIDEKHAPGTFNFYPCPHCEHGKADFVSLEARDQHIRDYHEINTGGP